MRGIRRSQRSLVGRLVGLVAIASTALAGSMVLQGSARAVVPGENGRIAFVRCCGGDAIYTVDPDGTHERRIATHHGLTFTPRFSPDASTIVYASDPGTSPGYEYSRLRLVGSDGTGDRELTPTPADDPRFAPDGSTIAFRCHAPTASIAAAPDDICVIKSDGTGLRRITGFGGVTSLGSFSPDGSRILFSRAFDEDGTFDSLGLYSVNIDGSRLVRIRSAGQHVFDPSYSPDGRKIVFSTAPENAVGGTGGNVFLMNADGSQVTALLPEPEGADGNVKPVFSPDGRRIVYVAQHLRLEDSDPVPDFHHGKIRIVNVDGTHDAFLFAGNDGETLAPDWGAAPRTPPGPSAAACTPGAPVPLGYRLRTGTPGRDTLTGTSGHDLIRGLGGDDRIVGRSGGDILCGGSGEDTITGGDGRDIIAGGDGRDRINGGDDGDRITGGKSADHIKGSDGNDTVDGNDGRDTISGGNGRDRINGGDDGDHITGGNSADSISGGDGNDTVDGGDGNDTLSGGDGRDRIDGGDDNDHITGGAAADRLQGGSGRDWMSGGSGPDRIWGGRGKDRIFGGAGRDHLTGGPGKDRISGGGGRDRITQ